MLQRTSTFLLPETGGMCGKWQVNKASTPASRSTEPDQHLPSIFNSAIKPIYGFLKLNTFPYH